jgi:hypothetical protein
MLLRTHELSTDGMKIELQPTKGAALLGKCSLELPLTAESLAYEGFRGHGPGTGVLTDWTT